MEFNRFAVAPLVQKPRSLFLDRSLASTPNAGKDARQIARSTGFSPHHDFSRILAAAY